MQLSNSWMATILVCATVVLTWTGLKLFGQAQQADQLSQQQIQAQPIWNDIDIDSCWRVPQALEQVDSVVKVYGLPLIKNPENGKLLSIVHVVIYKQGIRYLINRCSADPVNMEDTAWQAARHRIFTRWAD